MKSFLVGGVFLLLFVLLKVVCCEGCLKQEREALVALNSHLGNTMSWSANTNTDCCEWKGVECNTTTGRVTKLDLSYVESDTVSFHDFQTVLQTISPKLLHLEVLDIGGNHKMSNEILPSLRGFRSLKELYLSEIGLDSDLHFQGLCATLKNLEILDISWNNFNDTDIASALSGLSSLKSLNLQWSQLTMRSIQNISKLRSLEILDLSANKLNSWSLENHGFGFAWPSSLQVLSLNDNSLSNNILSYLSGLPRLKSLELSDNNLKGSLDISGFHGLSNLEYLALDYSSNLENEFFKSIGDLPSLKVLSVSHCGINGTLPIGDWSKLKNLEELDLSYNDFVGKLPSSFFNMTSLRTLKLAENHFIGSSQVARRKGKEKATD